MPESTVMQSQPAKADVAAILGRARRHKNLTLRMVEAATGIPNAHLSQIETGRIACPSMDVLYELSVYYNLDFALLAEAVGYDRTLARDALIASRLRTGDMK